MSKEEPESTAGSKLSSQRFALPDSNSRVENMLQYLDHARLILRQRKGERKQCSCPMSPCKSYEAYCLRALIACLLLCSHHLRMLKTGAPALAARQILSCRRVFLHTSSESRIDLICGEHCAGMNLFCLQIVYWM